MVATALLPTTSGTSRSGRGTRPAPDHWGADLHRRTKDAGPENPRQRAGPAHRRQAGKYKETNYVVGRYTGRRGTGGSSHWCSVLREKDGSVVAVFQEVFHRPPRHRGVRRTGLPTGTYSDFGTRSRKDRGVVFGPLPKTRTYEDPGAKEDLRVPSRGSCPLGHLSRTGCTLDVQTS